MRVRVQELQQRRDHDHPLDYRLDHDHGGVAPEHGAVGVLNELDRAGAVQKGEFEPMGREAATLTSVLICRERASALPSPTVVPSRRCPCGRWHPRRTAGSRAGSSCRHRWRRPAPRCAPLLSPP